MLAVAALIATYDTGLFPFAIAAAVVLFWSNGVIANFRQNPYDAPNWAAIASMVASLAALGLLIAGVVIRMSDGSTSSGTITWRAAEYHVGETQEVCGPVRGIAEDGGDTFLNIGEPYPNPDRFIIVVWNTTGLTGPPLGTEVCIEGEISIYEGVAQIQTQDWNDLRMEG